MKDDGSEYDSLSEYYHNGLMAFASMICRGIPDKTWLGKDERETERISTVAGIEAAGKCAARLRQELAGGASVDIVMSSTEKKGEFTNLTDWYTDGFMEFIHTISAKVPDKFQKSKPEITKTYSVREAIKAFDTIKVELERSIS